VCILIVLVLFQEDGSPQFKLLLSIPSSPPPLNTYVHDILAGKTLRIKIFPTCTCEVLRQKVQTAQIKQGLRLLPTQMQRLTIGGVEYPSCAMVFDVLRATSFADIVVEPRVTELVSMFLAGVCDLRDENLCDVGTTQYASPHAARSDSEHICIFGELDDFSLDGANENDDDHDDSPSTSTSTSTSTSSSGFLSMHTPSCDSPTRNMCGSPSLILDESSGVVLSGRGSGHLVAQLHPVLDALSGQVTPVREHRIFNRDSGQALSPPCSFDERAALAALIPSPPGVCGDDAALRTVLLREVSVPEECYSSQLHLLVRGSLCEGDDGASLLRRFRIDELSELAMTVQSGLRHGHAPKQGGGGAPGFDYGRLVDGCCGGTYVMSDARGVACAVFKPADEEPYAPHNPKVCGAGRGFGWVGKVIPVECVGHELCSGGGRPARSLELWGLKM
jgi:hypothetical protein